MFFVIGSISYFIGAKTWAFWLLAASCVNGVLALLWATINPDWYFAKKAAAGIDIGIGASIRPFQITKIATTALLLFWVWSIGRDLAYFR